MILVATETGVNSLRRKIKLPKSKVERVAGQARAPSSLFCKGKKEPRNIDGLRTLLCYSRQLK